MKTSILVEFSKLSSVINKIIAMIATKSETSQLYNLWLNLWVFHGYEGFFFLIPHDRAIETVTKRSTQRNISSSEQ
jgi:hypothetical protein